MKRQKHNKIKKDDQHIPPSPDLSQLTAATYYNSEFLSGRVDIKTVKEMGISRNAATMVVDKNGNCTIDKILAPHLSEGQCTTAWAVAQTYAVKLIGIGYSIRVCILILLNS